ncbi:bifunctional 4-hydroxy-2-oxoglutarate aldolase/2-dehydro-3-deoxy-phosphogluconate aldolase [Reinekea marina]|uniref:Bifunctional 4-hydroxy-2-oxoglutarate aldolase/2-dehydro-3-deoxy-phosphogluconate aldolase n=1 Tax=Reinekea marina TaxID=1310421 RepID=A0ABV7WUF4_9GAMM|nr:bifunctional 4-hydroxy-2-oxoglutarate aldolase/2-dehydro-3-deoxy-phosphogluconate aldolase [Reinekea marina]MBU2863127.1 bifunctional 4-hydroxy-2-oxoglutarate aldolase/2-dehydro-3-deoxy-phosphogluconate aldolase [Reinekea forsetii]MDN3650169.1 bifunctional 4-hydroxy-2-oxoglutarate aldolase/2-dehydro-3-deoxy-phosphogluconate aldolase [Reinekea marina]
MSKEIEAILALAAPVIPVLTVNRVEDALPLAMALKQGGIRVIEVTLRTDAAMNAIAEMKKIDGLLIGAGTVTREGQLHELLSIGADFAVSPGATPKLLEAGKRVGVPFLPAISSVSDMMQGIELGYRCFKFFPAEAAGGVESLKSFAGPFPDVSFCPTGGITEANFKHYLELPSVLCVGGSWLVPADAINQQDWSRVTQLAQSALGK